MLAKWVKSRPSPGVFELAPLCDAVEGDLYGALGKLRELFPVQLNLIFNQSKYLQPPFINVYIRGGTVGKNGELFGYELSRRNVLFGGRLF